MWQQNIVLIKTFFTVILALWRKIAKKKHLSGKSWRFIYSEAEFIGHLIVKDLKPFCHIKSIKYFVFNKYLFMSLRFELHGGQNHSAVL